MNEWPDGWEGDVTADDTSGFQQWLSTTNRGPDEAEFLREVLAGICGADDLNPAIVQILLQAGAEPSNEAFFRTLGPESISAAKLLLDAGANPNWPDPLDENVPLVDTAVGMGRIEIVRLMLAAGRQLSPEAELWFAADTGDLATLRSRHQTGERLAHVAIGTIEHGHLECLKFILSLGEATESELGKLFYYARLEGRDEILDFLEQRDPDVAAKFFARFAAQGLPRSPFGKNPQSEVPP